MRITILVVVGILLAIPASTLSDHGIAAAADVSPISPEQLAEMAGMPGFPARFEVMIWDADDLVADLEDGRVSVETQGMTYVLILEEYVLRSPDAVMLIESEQVPIPGPAPRGWIGSVEDVDGASAGLAVVDGAVLGSIMTPDRGPLLFSPVHVLHAGVPKNVVLSYWRSDATFGGAHKEGALDHDFGRALPIGDDSEVRTAAVSNKGIYPVADSGFYNYWEPRGGHVAQIDRVMSYINNWYSGQVGFTMPIILYTACISEWCDDNLGFNSNDNGAVMGGLGNHCETQANSVGSSLQLCHLFAERTFSEVRGMGDRPGRKGFSQTVPDAGYNGHDPVQNAEITAHEIGHNFCGRHSEAQAYFNGPTGQYYYSIMINPVVPGRMYHFFSNNPSWGTDNYQNVRLGNDQYAGVTWAGTTPGICDYPLNTD